MATPRTRQNLTDLFAAGQIPTEDDFSDLFSSGLNRLDDGIRKAGNTPLEIQVPILSGPAGDTQDLILFFEDFQQQPRPVAAWNMRLRSGGLEFSRGTGSDFLIDGSGNVGIGTDDINAALTVQGNGPVLLELIQAEQDGNDAGVKIRGSRNKNTTATVSFLDLANFDRDEGEGTDYTMARIAGTMGANTGQKGVLRLFTNGGVGENEDGLSERMRINSSGNVGIGTDNPLTKLHVSGNILLSGGTQDIGVPDGAHLQFGHLNITNNTFTERMRVNSSGNVGIGTDNPLTKLHVSGNILLSGGTQDIGVPDGAHLQFGHLNMTNNTFTERMIVNSSGNVGIGTTSPDAKLTIANIGSVNETKLLGFGQGERSLFWFESGFQPRFLGEDFLLLTDSLGNDLMTWSMNGNVGIGTSSPNNLLTLRANTPVLELFGGPLPRTSNGDNIGELIWSSSTSLRVNNRKEMGRIRMILDDAATSSNDASFHFYQQINSSEREVLTIQKGNVLVQEGNILIQKGNILVGGGEGEKPIQWKVFGETIDQYSPGEFTDVPADSFTNPYFIRTGFFTNHWVLSESNIVEQDPNLTIEIIAKDGEWQIKMHNLQLKTIRIQDFVVIAPPFPLTGKIEILFFHKSLVVDER